MELPVLLETYYEDVKLFGLLNRIDNFYFFLGYVYMIFDNEKSVKSLLQNCSHDFNGGGDWYFKLTSRRLRTKEIRQVAQLL